MSVEIRDREGKKNSKGVNKQTAEEGPCVNGGCQGGVNWGSEELPLQSWGPDRGGEEEEHRRESTGAGEPEFPQWLSGQLPGF